MGQGATVQQGQWITLNDYGTATAGIAHSGDGYTVHTGGRTVRNNGAATMAVDGANVGVANAGDHEVAHEALLPWVMTGFDPKTGLS